MISLSQSVLSQLSAATDTGAVNGSEVISFAVSLKPSNLAAFEAFCDSVSDPTSPNYGHFITPQEVGQRYGASTTDQNSVVNFLKSKNLTVTFVAPNRLSVLVQGTASKIESAFGVKLRNYTIAAPDGSGVWTFRANSTALKVPIAFASKIEDVSGIETYSRPKARANTQTLTPALTRALYNTAPMFGSSFQGQGRTIAVSNYDGFRLADAASFITQYALPTPSGGPLSNVTVVPISGGAGSGTPAGEGDLDIQMELATAPLANIIIYDGGSSDLIGVLTKEASDNKADIISESWGWNISASTAQAAHNQHLSMTAQGITYLVASGDFGTQLDPFSYPNYDSEILAIGGTVATVNDSTGARVSEVGWSGSGGGWSTNTSPLNVLPSWQVGTGVPTNINKRLNPDVSAHASGNGGAYFFFTNGGMTTGDGTSFASPVFTGCLAIAEQKLISLGKLPTINGKQRFGRIANLIYSQDGRSDVYFDITTGSNGLLPNGTQSVCGTKWDTVTGFGVMDFNAFVNSLNTISDTQIAPTSVSPDQGTYISGDVTSLADSDEDDYVMQSYLIDTTGGMADGTNPPTAQVASFEADFQIDLSSGSLVDLKALVEAHCDTTGVAGQMFGYNWDSGKYEVIKAFSFSTSDKVSTLTIPATSFSKFVDGSGNVRLLFRGIASIKPGRPSQIPPQFNMSFDQLEISPSFSS